MTTAKGHRLPKNYALVYDIIREAGPGHHFSTQNLYDLARLRQPRIGYSTVHRALQRLSDLAMIGKLSLPGADAVAYEVAAGDHAHFHCERCGQVVDVDYTIPARTLSTLGARHKLAVRQATLTLSGICERCRAN